MDNQPDYKLLKAFFQAIDRLQQPVGMVVRFVLITGMYPFTMQKVLQAGLGNPHPMTTESKALLALCVKTLHEGKMSEVFLVQAMAHFMLDSMGYLTSNRPPGHEHEATDQMVGAQLREEFGPYTHMTSLRAIMEAVYGSGT